MKNATSLTIEGTDDLFKNLDLTKREARNLNRSTVQAVAGKVRSEARKRAPKESGTLKKAIVAKRKKSPPDTPVSEVRVEHGAGAKHDAFYWRFVEFGTGGGKGSHGGKGMRGSITVMPNAKPFMTPAIEAIRPDIQRIYREEFGKKLEAMMRRKAKKK